MDFLMQCCYFLLTLITLIASLYLLHKRRVDGTKSLPPGSLGWPLVGETLQFSFKKKEHFLEERVKKYSSEIFKTSINGEPTVVLCGPRANKFLSVNDPNLIKVWYMKTQRRFFNIPDQTHAPTMPKQSVAKILGFLKPEGIAMYLGNRIESIMHQHFMTHWEGEKEIQVFPLAKAFSLSVAYQIFLGIDDPLHMAKFATKFDNLYHGLYSIPVNFPGSTYSKALKASATIREDIEFFIKEKIEALSKGQVMDDLLAHLIGAEKEGKYVSKIEICNIIMGLMNSSYISIAVILAFMIKHIGQRPDIYQEIVNEHAQVAKSKGYATTLDWDSIQKLKYTWAVAQETIRLYPTAPGAFREAITDITYEGFTIPKGWKIFWAVIGTNKNPKYFDEPEYFDPSRFEGNNPAPYTYIPFGAGPRSCPGIHYTRFVVLNFIHNLIKKFKWEDIFPYEKVSADFVPIPAQGIPIRLHHL